MSAIPPVSLMVAEPLLGFFERKEIIGFSNISCLFLINFVLVCSILVLFLGWVQIIENSFVITLQQFYDY